MKKGIAGLAVLGALLLVPTPPLAEAGTPDYRYKLRKVTPRNPIPMYIVMCESGNQLHRAAADGLGGGRYQIIPTTWIANLPRPRIQRIAGGDKGPIWSSKLLQDLVAAKIWRKDGRDAWVCA